MLSELFSKLSKVTVGTKRRRGSEHVNDGGGGASDGEGHSVRRMRMEEDARESVVRPHPLLHSHAESRKRVAGDEGTSLHENPHKDGHRHFTTAARRVEAGTQHQHVHFHSAQQHESGPRKRVSGECATPSSRTLCAQSVAAGATEERALWMEAAQGNSSWDPLPKREGRRRR
jgi:hypothetical protein